MMQTRAFWAVLMSVWLVTACTPGLFSSLTGAPGGVGGSAAPTAAAVTDTSYEGRVLGLDGKPAAGVEVQGYLISNNTGSLVSNNTGSLISHNGSKYGIQADELKTVTDGEGRFTLESQTGLPMNVEAVLASDVKAIRLKVDAGARDLTLQLAYTGTVTGRVTAPSAPTVTDFTGVDVFIPGTSYLAKTNLAGMYTLTNVAVGTFDLVASKQGLGSASATGVGVQSKAVTEAPDLALAVAAPAIASVTPSNGGPGTLLTIKGENFGASTGATYLVFVGGALAGNPKRLDDSTIQVTVPSGAVSEDVLVTVGEVLSNTGSFTVLKKLVITPPLSYLGQNRARQFRVAAFDTRDRLVTDPNVQWGLERGTSVSVTNGLVTGLAEGRSVLSVTSGTVVGTHSVQVEPSVPVANTLAGSTQGFRDDVGVDAQFNYPHGVAIAPDGSLYVSDRNNNRIRRVAMDGHVTTVAGSGAAGSADGIGTAAQISGPVGLAFAPDGILYVAEAGYNKIRRIDRLGNVSTIAGHGGSGVSDGMGVDSGFNGPHGLALDRDGNLYVADWGNNRVRRIDSFGGVTTLMSDGTWADQSTGTPYAFDRPIGVAVDAAGTLYVAEWTGCRIVKRSAAGTVSTLAGGNGAGDWDATGEAAQFNWPHDLEIGPDGNLYVTEQFGNRIRRVTPDGVVTTFAGGKVNAGIPTTNGFADGGKEAIQFNEPFGIAIDASGSMYVGDRNNNRIRVVTP